MCYLGLQLQEEQPIKEVKKTGSGTVSMAGIHKLGTKGMLRSDEISWQWIQVAQDSGLFQQEQATLASESYFGASIWEGCREHRMQTLEVSSKYALTMAHSAPRTG